MRLVFLLLLLLISQAYSYTPAAAGPLAIVYLIQKRHATYSRPFPPDSIANTRESIRLLYENVLGWTKADVIIFHNGDLNATDLQIFVAGAQEGARLTKGPLQAQLLSDLSNSTSKQLRLEEVPGLFWHPPPFLQRLANSVKHGHDKHLDDYKIGYLNMMRFYAMQVFKLLKPMGYAWVMREDDDSKVTSPIEYDLVQTMTDKGLDYGFRISMVEPIVYSRGFPEALQLYISMEHMEPTFLYEACNPQSRAGLTETGWSGLAYYNNFFISSIDPWLGPEVQKFLGYLDRTGGMYTHRWSDALVHGAVVQMFMPKERVHHFSDFAYNHNNEHAQIGVAMHWGTPETRFYMMDKGKGAL